MGLVIWTFHIAVEEFCMFEYWFLLILNLFLGFLRDRPFSQAIGYWPFGYFLYFLQKDTIRSLDFCIFLLLYHVLLLLVKANLRVIVMLAEKPLLEKLPLLF